MVSNGDPLGAERRVLNVKIIEFMATATEEIKGMRSDIARLDSKVAIQNGRVFKLEKWQAFILGGVALLGVMGSMISMAIIWFHK